MAAGSSAAAPAGESLIANGDYGMVRIDRSIDRLTDRRTDGRTGCQPAGRQARGSVDGSGGDHHPPELQVEDHRRSAVDTSSRGLPRQYWATMWTSRSCRRTALRVARPTRACRFEGAPQPWMACFRTDLPQPFSVKPLQQCSPRVKRPLDHCGHVRNPRLGRACSRQWAKRRP